MQCDLWIGEGPGAVHREVANRLERLISAHPPSSGPFRLALSGGSTPKGLYELLASGEVASRIPWERVHLFFADERCVPADHPDSNFRLVRSTLLDRLPRPPAKVFPIRFEGEECGPDKAALRYEMRINIDLESSGGSAGELDLALLGVGEDGHTASLIPGAADLGAEDRRVITADPPAGANHRRVTLSLPFLRRTRAVWFLVTGAGKAAVMAKIHGEGGDAFPAARIAARPGQVTWFLDSDAASGIPGR